MGRNLYHPARLGATVYTVEVVRRKQAALFIQPQDWEQKVLRDVEDVLAGRPIR